MGRLNLIRKCTHPASVVMIVDACRRLSRCSLGLCEFRLPGLSKKLYVSSRTGSKAVLVHSSLDHGRHMRRRVDN